MNYKDIIADNRANHSPVNWWPLYAYHCTDIRNAVSILSSGYLYSRINAESLNMMQNNNASLQVIEMTRPEIQSSVRFYFRPLTPTQYHNEGYKHPSIRYNNDSDANMPVPVFFVFDLNGLLSLPGIRFSEKSQAGNNTNIYSTIDEFSKFDFDKIYSNGYSDNPNEIKKFRHAELLFPDKLCIDSCLLKVCCRNSVERSTLLNLLKQENNRSFHKYSNYITIGRDSMFEKNGLFIQDCRYIDGIVSIYFADTYKKSKYAEKMMKSSNLHSLSPIRVRLKLQWLSSKNEICHETSASINVDYLNPKALSFSKLSVIPNARTLQISIYFGNDLMCCIKQPLSDTELIR